MTEECDTVATGLFKYLRHFISRVNFFSLPFVMSHNGIKLQMFNIMATLLRLVDLSSNLRRSNRITLKL
jgi:hypothetical protein